MSSLPQKEPMARSGSFPATEWGAVRAAANDCTGVGKEALESFCRSYWYPLYAHVRRSGYGAHDAQDLTQAFFAQLLEKQQLKSADPARGKLRSFLLASLKNFLINEWDRAHTAKRGGKNTLISLDAGTAEERYAQEPKAEASLEKEFERRWAAALLERALALLRQECIASGKRQQFEQLATFLSTEVGNGDYAAAAKRLESRAGSVAVAVHRLRQRYAEIVRAEILTTVSTHAESEEEMRHLFAALG